MWLYVSLKSGFAGVWSLTDPSENLPLSTREFPTPPSSEYNITRPRPKLGFCILFLYQNNRGTPLWTFSQISQIHIYHVVLYTSLSGKPVVLVSIRVVTHTQIPKLTLYFV